jgi:hypothetical protein
MGLKRLLLPFKTRTFKRNVPFDLSIKQPIHHWVVVKNTKNYKFNQSDPKFDKNISFDNVHP